MEIKSSLRIVDEVFSGNLKMNKEKIMNKTAFEKFEINWLAKHPHGCRCSDLLTGRDFWNGGYNAGRLDILNRIFIRIAQYNSIKEYEKELLSDIKIVEAEIRKAKKKGKR